jgi:subtilisin family serine protease
LQTITVGAVDSSGVIANFSSDGPTVDGRLKPEVLARGVSTFTVNPNDDQSLAAPNGTSLSTPLVAAAAACLVQAHPEWTVAQMRSALFQTASDYQAAGAPDPLFVRGYGIIDALTAARADPSPADIDGDFQVGVVDLVLLILAWGPCPGCPQDVNRDGAVDVQDLVLLIADWGPSGE